MEIIRVEWLARDLKSLVGYGAKPRHVVMRPALRDLILDKYPQIEARDLGVLIVHELREAVKDLEEGEALTWLLNLRDKQMSALDRRIEAIYCLGGGYGVEAWRRPDGPELDLMRKLARVLLDRVRYHDRTDGQVDQYQAS